MPRCPNCKVGWLNKRKIESVKNEKYFCENCYSIVKVIWKYCPNCGNKLKSE